MAVAMPAPAPPLSFATDLLFNLEDVRTSCTRGLATQGNLMTLLKSRVALERSYAAELSKMAQQSQLDTLECGTTMKHALGKMCAQYLNTSVQHSTLAKNLEEDVLRPVQVLHAYNTERAQNLNKLVNNMKKQAKVLEDLYKKDYQAFDKVFREASIQFGGAMDAGFSSTVIEYHYHAQIASLDECETMSDRVESSTDGEPGHESPRSRQITVGSDPRRNSNNSHKLVNWLLASEQQRKSNLCTNAVKAMKTAEAARRKCRHSWESVEQGRIDMYRTLQSVLTEYQVITKDCLYDVCTRTQQIAEHRISNLATNLRKHVIFESSALANEQYDWQMIASNIENVDFEGDIREFILEHRIHDLDEMSVSDLHHGMAGNSLATLSPTSKPCRPVKATPLQMSDLALRKIPYDDCGNRASIADLLVTRAAVPVMTPRKDSRTNTGEPESTASTAESDGDRDDNTTESRPAYQVVLAQDVAHVIASSYERRAATKDSCDLAPHTFSQDDDFRPENENDASETTSITDEI